MHEEPNYFSLDYKQNLTKLESKIAFTVEDYFTDEAKMDPDYVKIIVSLSGHNRDGKKFRKLLNYHKCTDSDLATFPKVNEESIYEYGEITGNENRGF